MHNTIEDHLTNDGIRGALEEMANKQNANKAYCKLRFKYPWTQLALRTRKPLNNWDLDQDNYQELENGEKISLEKMEGHIAYDIILEGRYSRGAEREFQFFLTVNYVYSSTCPCSFELAHSAKERRNAAANAHSQRSIMKTTVEYDPENVVWIEDLIELHRQLIPTEVQVVVKRRDEQAFAELNGSNLLFSEDAVRIMYKGLEDWVFNERIFDFTISTSHEESLHPWNAVAVVWYKKDLAIKG
jgi:GTP cyclohydrolase FolE2